MGSVEGDSEICPGECSVDDRLHGVGGERLAEGSTVAHEELSLLCRWSVSTQVAGYRTAQRCRQW